MKHVMRFLLGALCAAVMSAPALADINYTQGSGTVIFDFTCFTTKHCSAHVPINSSGVEIFTPTTPAQVSLANTGANATPILTTANQGTPTNWLFDLKAMGGTSINSGCVGALSGFSAAIPGTVCGVFGSYVLNAPPNGAHNTANSSTVNIATDQSTLDPCSIFAAKINIPISMTGTTTVKLVSLVASQKIYICSLNLRASAATVWSIADGTKVSTECDTAAEAVIGATTATHGLSETANGGNAHGSGNGTIALTNTAAHDLCLFQSGAGDLSGNLTYVQRVP